MFLDDIVCQTLKFEAQTYLTDIETTWSDDYGKQEGFSYKKIKNIAKKLFPNYSFTLILYI